MGTVTWYLTSMSRASGTSTTWNVDTTTTVELTVFFGSQAEYNALPATTQATYEMVLIDTNGDDKVGAAELRSALTAANRAGHVPNSMLPSNNQGYLGTADVNYDGDGLEPTGGYSTGNSGIESTTTGVMITIHPPEDYTAPTTSTYPVTADPNYKGGVGNFDPFFPGSLGPNPVCFVTGTMIDTPDGPRPVEALAAGDLVLTADRGAIPLRLSLSAPLNAAALARQPELRPIRIAAGALGAGLPNRDLLVSPQHRILVRSRIAQRMFGTDEVLVAAKQLLMLDGIDIAQDVTDFSYHHLVFDRHEIVLSNGAASESLYLGPEAMRNLGRATRVEIYTLFPHLRDPDPESIVAARVLTSGRQARKLANRHLQNHKPLLG